jgi:hypothetical protein
MSEIEIVKSLSMEPQPDAGILEDSQDLSEEKLSVLKALADSLGTSLESLLSLFPYLLILIGADHDSNPVDFNNQQADVKIGKCPSDGTSTKPEDLDVVLYNPEVDGPPVDDLENDAKWKEYCDWLYEQCLKASCAELRELADDMSSEMSNQDGLPKQRIGEQLQAVIAAMKTKGCLA